MKINNIIPSKIIYDNQGKLFSGIKNMTATIPSVPKLMAIGTIPAAAFLAQSTFTYLSGQSVKSKSFEQTLEENFFQLPDSCKPDEYQVEAARSIHKGNDTLVTAPTGTGKTAIAYYAISKNMSEGKKTFYTTPLKALSNEKFKQLQKIYGEENVGLSTGDRKVNIDAPIVVMTTEIYRNMVFSDRFKDKARQLDNLKTVIFDELHYMGDVDRGGIWEQSIILSNPETQLLSLSATIGNNQDVNNWMSQIRGKKGDLINVPSEKRHVPLEFKVEQVVPRGGKVVLPFSDKNMKKEQPSAAKKVLPPDDSCYIDMVTKLHKEDKLPAIFFVYSKKTSKILLDKFKQDGWNLNNKDRQQQIESILKKYEEDGKYLGETLDIEALYKGYAIHNAGLLPSQKELVEELFQKKLVQVVIATGTLSAGINMPARTVVISSTRIPTEPNSADGSDGKRAITVNEFHQTGGRAGRRGIDIKGYVYALSTSPAQTEQLNALINSSPEPIVSHFNPDYSFITNYYSYSKDESLIKELLSKSFQTYDVSPEKSAKKVEKLLNVFNEKKAILQSLGFINNDNSLSPRGELLSKMNGYQQIPIVDMVYDKKLFALTPVEIAASVATMAMTSERVASFQEQDNKFKSGNKNGTASRAGTERFIHKDDALAWFVEKFDGYLEGYNKKMFGAKDFQKIAQDKEVPKHLYDWANLNSQNIDSRENWKTLCTKYIEDKVDEGSLFKEITQTVDLLKQMSNVVEAGLETAKTADDRTYYKDLNSKLKDAIDLLSKEPIQEI